MRTSSLGEVAADEGRIHLALNELAHPDVHAE